MAAPSKEVRTQIDSVTLDRHERLYARGDHARIAEKAELENPRMITYYLKAKSAPVKLAIALKEYYEEKEATMQLLETSKK